MKSVNFPYLIMLVYQRVSLNGEFLGELPVTTKKSLWLESTKVQRPWQLAIRSDYFHLILMSMLIQYINTPTSLGLAGCTPFSDEHPQFY